jgi:hypothetical protein
MTAAILHRCGLAAVVFLPEDGAEQGEEQAVQLWRYVRDFW